MKHLLFYTLQLILISLVVVWLIYDPGMVRIDWQGVQYELSLATGVGVLLFGIILLNIIGGTIKFILTLPKRMQDQIQSTYSKKGHRAITLAYINHLLKQYDVVQQEAQSIERYLPENPLSFYFQGQSYLRVKNYEKAQEFFIKLESIESGRNLAYFGLIQVDLARSDWAMAYRHLQQILRDFSNSPWILETLVDVCIRLKKYTEAIKILQHLVHHNLLPREKTNYLQACILEEESKDPSLQLDLNDKISLLQQAHHLDPSFIPGTLALARLYKIQEKNRKAKRIIEQNWKLSPHPKLADMYVNLDSTTSPIERADCMQILAKNNPDHSQSLLSLAWMYLEAQQWGRVRGYLKELDRKKEPLTRSACACHAQLELQEKRNESACRHWLLKALTARPDPQWRCKNCQASLTDWTFHCPKCEMPGIIFWQES